MTVVEGNLADIVAAEVSELFPDFPSFPEPIVGSVSLEHEEEA